MTRRAGLTHAAVVEAAAALVDTKGWDALSLADLATQLGIRTPSLYNHVAGLDGLRHDLALQGMRELSRRLGRATIGKANDDAVLALAQAYRTFVREHPGLYAATVRPSSDPDDTEMQTAQSELVTIVLAVVASYGLQDDDALHAVRGLRSLAHGFASLEQAGGFELPLNNDESFRRLIMTFAQGLRQLSL